MVLIIDVITDETPFHTVEVTLLMVLKTVVMTVRILFNTDITTPLMPCQILVNIPRMLLRTLLITVPIAFNTLDIVSLIADHTLINTSLQFSQIN